MKNASAYEKKINKILRGMKTVSAPTPPKGLDAVALMIESILQADATKRQAKTAMNAIAKEYLDFNELRVSPVKDLVDCIGRNYPGVRTKTKVIVDALRGIFSRTYNVTLDHMADMTKKDLRRHLDEIGLDTYSSACVNMFVFGGHAIPVDESLAEVLLMNEDVHPESTLEDVQSFLTRIITQKKGHSAHEAFRQYVTKHAKALDKKRKIEQKAREKAEAEALVKAEAKAARKAAREAAAKVRAEAKAAALAEKEAEKKKAARAAARKKAAKKKAKKTVKKTAKKTVKKTAKKPVKKAAQKAVKKAAKKTVKKTTKKAAQKAIKKKTKKAAKKK